MNDLDFRQQVLNTLTTSCHHPPAHLVDIDKVVANPKLLHNTDQKKTTARKCRQAECEYHARNT
jgi:hypothetical protein